MFNLNGQLCHHAQVIGLCLRDILEHKCAANAVAAGQRRDKAQAIKSCVEIHNLAGQLGQRVLCHAAGHGERQEPMRDSALKRGLFPRSDGINMDELVIFSDGGKAINSCLINQYPRAVPQVHADLPALRGKGQF